MVTISFNHESCNFYRAYPLGVYAVHLPCPEWSLLVTAFISIVIQTDLFAFRLFSLLTVVTDCSMVSQENLVFCQTKVH